MKKTIKDLLAMIEKAKKRKCKLGVCFKGVPGLQGIETVVNDCKDLDLKAKYYQKNYSENLVNVEYPEVKIVNVMLVEDDCEVQKCQYKKANTL